MLMQDQLNIVQCLFQGGKNEGEILAFQSHFNLSNT